MKYKCKECGHIFEGDLSTTSCPECGSEDIVPLREGFFSKFPWKKVLIAIGIIAIIVLAYLLIRAPHHHTQYSISVSQDSVSVYVKAFCVGDSLDLRELRDSCQVLVMDSNDVQMDNPRLFSLKSNKLIYEISMFEPGCTYEVVLSKRKGGMKICSASFTIPLPPTPPVISVEPAVAETDPNDKCRLLGTYMVKIVVEKGTADKYSIDGDEYSSNVITGVKPRPKNSQYVIVRAYNAEDRLWSDSVSYKLPPINMRALKALSQSEIQQIFDKVAQRKMMAGDALDEIANGNNIKVVINGGRSDLEEELQRLYQSKKRLTIKKVIYQGTECSRSIEYIEI